MNKATKEELLKIFYNLNVSMAYVKRLIDLLEEKGEIGEETRANLVIPDHYETGVYRIVPSPSDPDAISFNETDKFERNKDGES